MHFPRLSIPAVVVVVISTTTTILASALPRPQAPHGASPREAPKHGRFDAASAAIGAVAGAGVVGSVGAKWASHMMEIKKYETETSSRVETYLRRRLEEHERERDQLKESVRTHEAEIRQLKGLPTKEEEAQQRKLQARLDEKERFVTTFLGMVEGDDEGEGVLPPGALQLVQAAADPAMKTCVYHSYLLRAPELLLDRLDGVGYWNAVVGRCIDELGRDRDTTLARWSLPASSSTTTTTTATTATEPHAQQPRPAVDDNHGGNPHPLNFVVHRLGTNVHRLVHGGVQAWQRAAWPGHAPPLGMGLERTTAKVKNAEWGLVKAFE
ncbi:MAG: hypothetical protein M1826_002671 [Phylliscum demangeonii]|nr:MAG: hypothetical protein M1826_002671 [Phylliscum demangeonii]